MQNSDENARTILKFHRQRLRSWGQEKWNLMEFVDLVKRFPTNVLIAAIGVDTAENGPFKDWEQRVST